MLHAAFLLIALTTVGCSTRPPVHASFPEAHGQSVFSTDDRSVVVRVPPRITLHDLDAAAPRWTYETTRRKVGVVFSPRGAYLLLIEAHAAPRDALVTVLRADTGARVFTMSVPEPGPAHLSRFLAVNDQARWFAVSDDGALVARATPQGTVQIVGTGGGSSVHESALERSIGAVAFEPGTHRLAFAAEYNHRMRVVGSEGGVWTTLATIEGAESPVWTHEGVVFRSSEGLQVWTPHATRRLVQTQAVFPGVYGYLWAAGFDGSYLAASDSNRVRLFDRTHSEAPSVVYEDPEPMVHQLFAQVALTPTRFRGFTGMGYFVELELPSGRLLQRVPFGVPWTSSRALFTDGALITAYYAATLSPSGRYVCVDERDGGANVYRTE